MAKKSRDRKSEKGDQSSTSWEGLVVKTAGAGYWVRSDDGSRLQECKIKGKFRLKGIRTTNPVAVGDRVTVVETHRNPEASGSDRKSENSDGTLSYITEIHPRRNYIIRKASNLSKESHILAANIDRAILVATLRMPETPIIFIDRFLATCEAYDIPATIALNKIDLLDPEDRELVDGLRYLYESLGYGFLEVSAETGAGIDALKEITKDKISLMAGNSGVGKSSLINRLVPGLDLKTGKISDLHRTGMHTTTFSEMITLPYGGELIDIPGVKGFGMIDFKKEEVSHYFPEIFKASRECKYADCRHTGEPGCHVCEMVDNHYISESRYNSYLNILEELDEGEKYRKPF